MRVAETVVRILEDEGIRVAFGIPGDAINPVYKYFKDSAIEVPAAIGAKIACPEDPAVVVVGDAGLLFMVQELAMAGQHQAPVIIICLNNGYLDLISHNQKCADGFGQGVSATARWAVRSTPSVSSSSFL